MGLFTAVFSSLKMIWNNKLLRYMIIGATLIISLKLTYSFISQFYYNNGYNAGQTYQIQVQKDEQVKLKLEYDKQLKIKDDERIALNNEINDLKKGYSDLQNSRKDKSNKTSEETKNYEKSANGSNLCLDPEWVRIYKNSLPE